MRANRWTSFVVVALASIAATTDIASAAERFRPSAKIIEYKGDRMANADAVCRAHSRSIGGGYTTILAAREAGDQIYCKLGDDQNNVNEQHTGVIRLTCPSNATEVSGMCECTGGSRHQGGNCVTVAETPVASAVPPPAARGMTQIDDEVLKGFALNRKLFILVRESNPAAVRFIGKAGYAPKPERLKAKTRQGDPAKDPDVGLASADPNDPRLKAMIAALSKPVTYDDYVKQITAKGFVVGPAPSYLVMDAKTKDKFYSDYDLHGVYDAQGKQAWKVEIGVALRARLKDRLIQHGPHDCWTKRNDPESGPNRGPQPPVTGYLPSGEMVFLRTIAEMEAFYKSNKIAWPYAAGAPEKWC